MNRTRVEEEIEAEGERSLVVVFACYWPRQTINQTQQLQHCNDCYVSLRVVTCTLRLCIANKIAERMSTRSPRESSTHGTSCDRNYPQQTPPFIPSQDQTLFFTPNPDFYSALFYTSSISFYLYFLAHWNVTRVSSIRGHVRVVKSSKSSRIVHNIKS